MDDTYIFEIIDGVLIERLDISGMNSICSNMQDTIYIARGTMNDRAYSIDTWEYSDLGNGLSSINWNDGKLISVSPGEVKTRSTNPNDT